LIGRAGLLRLSRARRRARSRWRTRLLLTLAVRRARLLLLTGPVQLTGLLLTGTIRHAWQRRLTGLSGQTIWPPLSGQTIWPLLARLQLPDRPVRIDEAGIGATEFALLEHELPADILRRVKLTHKALVAQHHGLRNRQRHRGEARAARARPDGEAARALREKAEPRAGAVVDLDPSDPAVGVGIKLDRDVVRIVGGGTFRHFDEAGGAANAERRRRRRDLHVAGFRHRGCNKSRSALGDVEDRGVPPVLTDDHEAIDADASDGI
jgi:hypothetical protein